MSWDLFYNLSKQVAEKIITSGYKADMIVGLARGGWVLSRVLCDFLGIKDLLSLKVEHWGVTATPSGKAQIKYPFHEDLSDFSVLVVDDITDTGQSLMVATKYVKTLNPMEIRTATLRHITGSEFTPDYFGDEVPWRWYIFPWNYTEDMCTIVPRLAEKTDNLEGVKRLLKEYNKLDIEVQEIARVLEEAKRREG
jgi:hypoxanthine phosphoribosyltransferase